jgi:hypothetical protein
MVHFQRLLESGLNMPDRSGEKGEPQKRRSGVIGDTKPLRRLRFQFGRFQLFEPDIGSTSL